MLLGSAMLSVSSAVWSDVEINQTKVLAGSISPGDTPGFPVTISRPGSYRLIGNLSVPDANTNGIEIKARDVTLDLGGFVLQGPVKCSGSPPVCNIKTGTGIGVNVKNPATGLIVRNGHVRGMGFAGLFTGNSSRVEGIIASGNAFVGLGAGTGSVVIGNVISDNSATGLAADNSTVIQNACTNNGRGISASGTVAYNAVSKNSEHGMVASGSVANNRARENGKIGIQVDGGTALNNQAEGNGSFGLSMDEFTGYANNVINFNNGSNVNPQVSGGIQMGLNICGGDTVCP